MNELVLSLFPGIDLLGRGFEEEGFTVVRGPDLLWGGDVRAFHPPAGRFEGIIGGPPCQRFSAAQNLAALGRAARGDGEPLDLIPEFVRCVTEARPIWFVMENVPAAPEPAVTDYATTSVLLNNRWLGEEQNRVRRFTFGGRHGFTWGRFSLDPEFVALEHVDYAPAVLASGSRWLPGYRSSEGRRRNGGVWGFKTRAFLEEARRLQGLPETFDLPSFTVREAIRAIGNGVPIPMARAVARAVRRCLVQERAA